MNTRTWLLFGGWVALLITAAAQEPTDTPMLVGDNVQAITPQIIETIQSLVAKQMPPAKSTRIWMLRRRSHPGNKPDKEFVSIGALLWPQISTVRLVRGQSVPCHNSPSPRKEYHPQTNGWTFVTGNDVIVNGWTFDGPPELQYAFVAPIDQPFTPTGPFKEPFELWGFDLADEEIVAIADTVRRLHPEKRLFSVKGSADFRKGRYVALHASCLFEEREPDKDGSHAIWDVTLRKEGSEWSMTKIENLSSLDDELDEPIR